MKSGLRILLSGLVAALFLPGTALGQWSADSLQNLQVCDVTGEQVTPKIAATSDGGCFVSWFDSRSGSYCMYLQRLDADGNKLFADDGLLVSDELQMSWLVDYDMAVDAEDNAVIVFCDTRNTADELDVSAYMISSDGTFLWGANGICLSDTSTPSFEATPSVAVTGTGNSIIAWSNTDNGTLIFQKISPAGAKLWGTNGIVFDDPVRTLAYPVLVPATGDQAIILFKSSTGSFPYQTTWLYTGLLDASGGWGWSDTPILVYDSGHMSAWAYPEAVPDSSGGAIFSWYDAVDLSTFEVWVQRVDSSGSLLFPANGAQASTNSDNRLHMYPSAVYYPSADETLVFWVEENDNQDQYGVYGQLFNSSGARQWTDSGLQLLPLGGNQISFVRAESDPGGAFVGYLIGTPGTAVRVIRIGYDQSIIWGPTTLSAASLGGKDDLVSCLGIGAGYIAAWSDSRNDYGIYAQRINQDGILGPALGLDPGQGPLTGSLSICPNPAQGIATLGFSMETAGRASIEVYDLTGRIVATVFSGDLGAGQHSVTWNSGDSGISSGIYFARLRTGGWTISERMALLQGD
jgi:hypothetical protein